MKKVFFGILSLIISLTVAAQSVSELKATAQTFLRQGDYTNAILVLNRALQQQPEDYQLQKDLALAYYFSKEPDKCLTILNSLLDKPDADDQVYMLAGNIYKLKKDVKEADKLYKRGLKRFPKSGPLYNDYGELLWATNNFKDALPNFEKGIETDPAYPNNYVNATYFLATTSDKIWQLLYGEIYLAIAPQSGSAPQLKEQLLKSYKKLFAEGNFQQFINEEKSAFGKAVLQTLAKQASVFAQGVTAETLIMARTRFIIDWYAEGNGTKFPFKLFEYHRQLLKDGMFPSYNQSIFGPPQQLSDFQAWVGSHSIEYSEFLNFQRNRMFKVPEGQYYRDK